MVVKRKKIRIKKPTTCWCLTAGSAKTIQINRGSMMAAELRESFVQIHGAIKIRILFLNLFATAN
jgi:hypothetical protein